MHDEPLAGITDGQPAWTMSPPSPFPPASSVVFEEDEQAPKIARPEIAATLPSRARPDLRRSPTGECLDVKVVSTRGRVPPEEESDNRFQFELLRLRGGFALLPSRAFPEANEAMLGGMANDARRCRRCRCPLSSALRRAVTSEGRCRCLVRLVSEIAPRSMDVAPASTSSTSNYRAVRSLTAFCRTSRERAYRTSSILYRFLRVG